MKAKKAKILNLDGGRLALLPSKCICCNKTTFVINQEQDNILTICKDCNDLITDGNKTLAMEYLGSEVDKVIIGDSVIVPRELYNTPTTLVDPDEFEILVENYKIK